MKQIEKLSQKTEKKLNSALLKKILLNKEMFAK